MHSAFSPLERKPQQKIMDFALLHGPLQHRPFLRLADYSFIPFFLSLPSFLSLPCHLSAVEYIWFIPTTPIFLLHYSIVPVKDRSWPTSKAEHLVLIRTIFVLWALILTFLPGARAEPHHNSELKAVCSLWSWDRPDAVSPLQNEYHLD